MLAMHLSDEWVQWYLSRSSVEPVPDDVDAHLAVCQPCKAKMARRPSPSIQRIPVRQPSYSDRRREHRIAVDEPASIKMLSPFEAEVVKIRILDLSRHGLRIWTPKLLESGVILQIRMREILIMGEVRYCRKAEQGYHAGLYIEDCVEQRQSARTAVGIPASIVSMSSAAHPHAEYSAKVLNRSHKGMLVAVPQRIPPGTAVRLVFEGKLYLAEVMHCQPGEDGFKIGIEVDQALSL